METAVPIFNSLKKGDAFAWTVESEEAFLRLKALLATPPILTRSTPSIPLLVYISVVDDVVNVAIVLQDTKRRYQRIEKVALTLIMASRRLRPYFQGYPLIVQIDLPIKQVLRKPNLAGRMVAWSIQLSEFDISYKSRGHIKAQVLIDFITKMTVRRLTIEEDNKWFLSVDGTSNQTRSGAGVILEGPNGVLIEKSLHFEFRGQ
ncbi:hypothetical protein CR513_11640, partial [Mucuna pruriens]